MPELPEVETIRLQLNKVLKGLIIKHIEVRFDKSFQGDKKEVIGKKILGLSRYGKLLVVNFANKQNLAIHLKMSGRLVYLSNKSRLVGGHPQQKNEWEIDYPTHKHTHVVFTFSDNSKLYFWDLRKFGWIKVVDNSKLKAQMSKLGIEPFTDNFTLFNFRKVLKMSKKPVKLVLMDQQKISGVGNIYANDGLFCAGIHPSRKADKVNTKESVRLFNCLIKVLKNGIRYGGASSQNFRDTQGQKGRLQEHFLVYDRQGWLCPNNCGNKIAKIQLGGRGTYFCTNCQK